MATLTTDIERHADFYQRVFGAVVTFKMDATDDHPRMWILDLGGGAALNVFETPAGSDRRRAPAPGWPRRHRPLRHRGRVTRRVGTGQQRLIDAGADIGEIQRLGSEWSLFFRDVDGMKLEVCAQAED